MISNSHTTPSKSSPIGTPRWIPLADSLPPQFEVVLTTHEDDLYPVCAYRTDAKWRRLADGPEDVIVEGSGAHGLLFRTPTHWQPIPESPLCELERMGLLEPRSRPLTPEATAS